MLRFYYEPKALSCLNPAASSGNIPLREVPEACRILKFRSLWLYKDIPGHMLYPTRHPRRSSIMCMPLALCIWRPSVTNDDLAHCCMSIQQRFCCQKSFCSKLKRKKIFFFFFLHLQIPGFFRFQNCGKEIMDLNLHCHFIDEETELKM